MALSFEPALRTDEEAFDAAGTECKSRATALHSQAADLHAVIPTRSAARGTSPPASRAAAGSDALRSRPCRSSSSPSSRSSRASPGPHVTAAVDAATAAGADVDFGPFGSTCRADDDAMPEIVAAITRAAFANGATHVSLHVARLPDDGRPPSMSA